MDKKLLEEFVKQLADLRRDHLQLDMLYQDIEEHYLKPYEQLPNGYRNAWDESVTRRLMYVNAVNGVIHSEFAQLKAKWRIHSHSASLHIVFGQMRIGPKFQAAQNVNQAGVVGLLNVVGQRIEDFAPQLHEQADRMPIHIFWHNSKWITANNRGFAAHCIANVRPLRLIPRRATQDEINRLNEVEGENNIEKFQYANNTIARLTQNKRRLPSNQMPITTGPNTWVIERVVDVPLAWL